MIWGLGSIVCHQIAERSLAVGGKQLFVCARCTGLYFGLVTSFLWLLASGRWRRTKIDWRLLALMLPGILDGFLKGSDAFGGNILRLALGLLAGAGAGLVFAPYLFAYFGGLFGAEIKAGSWQSKDALSAAIIITAGSTALLLAAQNLGGNLAYWALTIYLLTGFLIIELTAVIWAARLGIRMAEKGGKWLSS